MKYTIPHLKVFSLQTNSYKAHRILWI